MTSPATRRQPEQGQPATRKPAIDPSNTPQKENTMHATATTIRHARKPLLLSVLGLIAISFATLAQAMVLTSAPSIYNPQFEFGLSGGVRDAYALYRWDSFGNACRGFIHTSPDHLIRLRYSLPSLTIEVETHRYAADATLVVIHRETGTVYCDDDSAGGLDPMLSYWNWPAGTYEVFVGSYWRSDYHDYTLFVYQ